MKHQPNGKADMWGKCYPTFVKKILVFVREFWQMSIDLLITNKQQNLQTWNLDSTWELIKSLNVPILGIMGHVIMNWDTKKYKTAIFGLRIY